MNHPLLRRASKYRVALVVVAIALIAGACGGRAKESGGLRGSIVADGSSTVFPIAEAMAEAFGQDNPDVRISVGVSGTGGGFKKFCNAELDFTNASRPIKKEEIDACASKGVSFIELPIAFDGLSVVVNKSNDWVDQITVAELKTIWEPAAQGKITRWNQVRPSWPDRPMSLYGPGTDSGTFDYFTEAIVGKVDESRGDYTASEDDNVLVQGVAGDPNSFGYFGYAYYFENRDKLKAVPVVNPETSKAVAPSEQTIRNGEYAPLARPLFVYVSTNAAERPEVKAFIEFLLSNPEIVTSTGYVSLSNELYAKARQRFGSSTTGSVFGGSSKMPPGGLENVYK
jgi:phosphate transport system substrate-binding protein